MHDPRSIEYGPRDDDKRHLPTFQELINAAPPEYLDGEAYQDKEGKVGHLGTTVEHIVFTIVK